MEIDPDSGDEGMVGRVPELRSLKDVKRRVARDPMRWKSWHSLETRAMVALKLQDVTEVREPER